MITNIFRKIDKSVKESMVVNKRINEYLEPIYPRENDRQQFIRKCLDKQKTRRMLNRAHWYSEIADDIEKTKPGRVALKIIFLMSLAEGISALRIGKKHSKNIGSFNTIKEFFSHTSKEDRNKLIENFERIYFGPHRQTFRFSSIIRILYNVRNAAVHGEDYYSFSLGHGVITSVKTGRKKTKRYTSVDANISYDGLRDIFRRTAIENIKSVL